MDILARAALLTLLPLKHINLVYPFLTTLTGSRELNVGFLRFVDFMNRDEVEQAWLMHVQKNLNERN